MVTKNKEGIDWKFFSALAISLISIAFFVGAINLGDTPGIQITTNDTTTTTGSIWYNGTFLEDTNFSINITINNSLSGGQNVTYINITMPGDFYFVALSNGSGIVNSTNVTVDAFVFNVTNTTGRTQVLNWSNSSKSSGLGVAFNVTNHTTTAYWFNATVETPGTYNMSIYVMRNLSLAGEGIMTHENITIVVNDTTNVSNANWTTSANDVYTNNSNLSATGIRANLTFTDNGRINVINLTLYNSTHGIINSSHSTAPVNGTGGYSYYVNFTNTTGLPDGDYYINVTALNDTYGNNLSTWTELYRKITLDTTVPTVTFSCTPSADVNVGETVTCSCSATDATSGVKTTTYNSSGKSSAAESVTETCTVKDYANNSASKTVTYTVYASDAAAGTTTGGTTTGTTAIITDKEFEQGVAKELAVNDQAKVKINSTYHYVKVSKITGNVVKIEISSEPILANMVAGQERRFDIDGDKLYDIKVTLNGIKDGKADLLILSVSEQVTEVSEAEESAKEIAALGVLEPEEGEQPEAGKPEAGEAGKWWIWVVVIVAVLIIAGVIVGIKKKE